jgi:NADH dehydrogenase/NADH:ubiquinone oxidoreductase subunit G
VTEMIELTIDGKSVRVPSGTTILQAAQQAGIEIPVLCYFAHTTSNGLCRLCVVEIEGTPGMHPACIAHAQQDAVVHTRSPDIDRIRRTILEMLASTVDLSESPDLLKMMEEYDCHPDRFAGGEVLKPPLKDDNPVYIRDYAQCVLCWRCVQVCADDAQFTYAINFNGRGFHTTIGTFFDRPMPDTTCVFCGQCVGVCPTGALKAKREFLFEQGLSPEEIYTETRARGKGKRSKVGPRVDYELGLQPN